MRVRDHQVGAVLACAFALVVGCGNEGGRGEIQPPVASSTGMGSGLPVFAGAGGAAAPAPQAGTGGVADMAAGVDGFVGMAGSIAGVDETETPDMSDGAVPPPAQSACLEGISNYDQDGPFDYQTESSGRVKIWVPQVPSGCRVPLVHLANGTGAS